MTHTEKLCAAALEPCVNGFRPSERRFINALQGASDLSLTDRQRAYIYTLLHRYRRRIDPDVAEQLRNDLARECPTVKAGFQ